MINKPNKISLSVGRTQRCMSAILLLIAFAVGSSNAQDKIDSVLQPHKWEITLNMRKLLLFPQSYDWSFPYLVKRRNNQGGAWRLMVLPSLVSQGYSPKPQVILRNEYTWTVDALVGYEWQKQKGRFCYYYGIDGALRYQNETDKTDNFIWRSPNGDRVGLLKDLDQQTSLWVSPFIGAKFFITHRFSLSVESHLRLLYGINTERKYFEGSLMQYRKTIYHQSQPDLIYCLGLGYHF